MQVKQYREPPNYEKNTTIYFIYFNQFQCSIEDYKQAEVPTVNSEEHYKLNYAEDISIKLTDNAIEAYPTPRKSDSKLKFKEGLLIGSNHGEWGGKLKYTVGKKEIVIKEGNIIALFELNGKTYFLEGLAHLSTNYGAIYEIEYSNKTFHYKKVLQLPDEPEVFQIFNKKIYIATFENFIIVNNWKIENEITGFWSSLYPNSIIIENENHIFIGIRGGIVEIIPNEKKLKLYTKYKQHYEHSSFLNRMRLIWCENLNLVKSLYYKKITKRVIPSYI